MKKSIFIGGLIGLFLGIFIAIGGGDILTFGYINEIVMLRLICPPIVCEVFGTLQLFLAPIIPMLIGSFIGLLVHVFINLTQK